MIKKALCITKNTISEEMDNGALTITSHYKVLTANNQYLRVNDKNHVLQNVPIGKNDHAKFKNTYTHIIILRTQIAAVYVTWEKLHEDIDCIICREDKRKHL